MLCITNYCSVIFLLATIAYFHHAHFLAGVQLERNGAKIENHSFLRFGDVINGDKALLCVSNNTDCCTEDNANWFHPGFTTALTTSSRPYYVERTTTAPRNVALIRTNMDLHNAAQDANDGLYCCEIIDTDGNIQMLYIWLDRGSEGKHYFQGHSCGWSKAT